MKNPVPDLLQFVLPNLSLHGTVERLRRQINGIFELVSREHVLSLTDQGVVSGSGFLSVLLIARWSGASELGVYALGSTLLFSLVACQDSLILEPYLIQRYYPQGTPVERASASFVLSLLFSAVSALALGAAALACQQAGTGSEIVMMLWVISAVSPFALARNFARWFYFARLEFGSALVLDATIAFIQLASFQWLGANGRMSAVNACIALGTTYAVAAVGWLVLMKEILAVRLGYVRSVLQQSWALGKWLLAGQITVQAPGNVTYWLSMSLLGATVTGVFSACMSIVAFVNPLLHGLRNAMMPKLVLAWKNGGGQSLWEEAVHNVKLIALLIVPASLAVAIAGEPIMRILYHGNEFAGHGHELGILALAGFCGALGIPASLALATMERPRAIVAVTSAGAGVTLGLVWILMNEWGLVGVVYGLLGGNLFGAVGRWLALFTRVAKSRTPACDPKAATSAVQDLTKCTPHGHWTTTRLGDGDHAETFLIESKGPPIFRNQDALVVKVYKAEAALSVEMARAQSDSLLKLHAVLDGRDINGWQISVPYPLHLCHSPLALVMTAARGRHIEAYASKRDARTSLIEAARICALAMQQCWSTGGRHGDLWLSNVLLDLENKEISFIDAGTFEACSICNDRTNVLVAAREIAHLLCLVASDLSGLFGRSAVRTTKEVFVQHFLLATIKNIDMPEQREQLLNEIWFWAQQHLRSFLTVSWSIQAAWCRFVRQVATYRIRWILERVEVQSNIHDGQNIGELEFAVQPTQPVVR